MAKRHNKSNLMLGARSAEEDEVIETLLSFQSIEKLAFLAQTPIPDLKADYLRQQNSGS